MQIRERRTMTGARGGDEPANDVARMPGHVDDRHARLNEHARGSEEIDDGRAIDEQDARGEVRVALATIEERRATTTRGDEPVERSAREAFFEGRIERRTRELFLREPRCRVKEVSAREHGKRRAQRRGGIVDDHDGTMRASARW